MTTNAFGVEVGPLSKAWSKDRKEKAKYAAVGATGGGVAGHLVGRALRPISSGEQPPRLEQHPNGGGNNNLMRAEHEQAMQEFTSRKAREAATNKEFDSIMRGNRMGRRMARTAVAANPRGVARSVAHAGKPAAIGAGVGALYGLVLHADKKQRERTTVVKNAFGIEVGSISKKERKEPDWGPHGKPSVGRVVTGAMAPGVHGLIAGAPGHKMRAAGREVGESAAGTVVGTGVASGTAAGLHRVGVPGPLASEIGSEVGSGIVVASGIHSVMGNQKKGRYKKQRPNALGLGGKKPKTVSKAFQDEPIEKGLGEAFKVGVDAAKGGLGALKTGASARGAKLVAKKPVQAGIASFKATKLGVKPGPITTNRVAAHAGIAAGHATTVGGAAMGLGGVAVGAGAMNHHNKSTLLKAFREELAKSEWKTIKQRERAQVGNRKAKRAGLTAASMGGTALAAQEITAAAANTPSPLVGLYNSGRWAKMVGGSNLKEGAQVAGMTLRNPRHAVTAGALGLATGGAAVAGGARGREAYHQHKINQRRRARMG